MTEPNPLKGTDATREFYDQSGWKVTESGVALDAELFGDKETGPIRQRVSDRMWQRIFAAYGDLEGSANFLEVGCGGNPERRILTAAGSYTGSDFSKEGLRLAAENARGCSAETEFVLADATSLPFDDNTFDCIYSAHMIYHIVDADSQKKTLEEMHRVLKPSGKLVVVTANPRPILFPARFLIRVVAETPGLRDVARRLKGPSPIPYNPQRISWMYRCLGRFSKIDHFTGGIASTAFNQKTSEFTTFGRALWTMVDTLEERFPRSSAALGNYVVFSAVK